MPPVPKIAQLPDEIRRWLHETLVDRAFGDIVAVTDELQEMLRQAGIAMYIGKSAVGAESLKLKRAQESIKASTEAAKLIVDSARDDGDARGEALMALISSDMFDCLLKSREAEGEEDPIARLALMSEAAKSASRLTMASVSQRKMRRDVEERAAKAAEAVTKIARTGGLQQSQVDEIRAQILGIPRRQAAADKEA
jgi:hypothetical protein